MPVFKLSMRIVGIAGLLSVVLLPYAFRTESTGMTFAMGNGFNLRIDSHALYNGVLQSGSTWNLKDLNPHTDKFFNISDVKPGDSGENTISFHVNKDSWICLDFENLKQKENGRNEPELHEDGSGGAAQGELAAGTEFFAWYDTAPPHPGDNIFQVGELPIFGTSTQAGNIVLNNKTYALADFLTGNPFPANVTKYIGITWCAGNLTVSTSSATITCDGSALGNVAQTDSFSVDVSFRAVQKSSNPTFRCERAGLSCERSCKGKCNNSVTINIDNHGTINSTTTSNSNTGGNTAGGGGTVETGNASSTSNSTNILDRIRILIGR